MHLGEDMHWKNSVFPTEKKKELIPCKSNAMNVPQHTTKNNIKSSGEEMRSMYLPLSWEMQGLI